MTFDQLKAAAAKLPTTPGVYIMKDSNDSVIYVGKAKALKNRVSQYFLDLASHSPKTRRMVSKIDHFETIYAPSEFEALLLENTLIKKYKPKYNILLKDDKGYPFIALDSAPFSNFVIVSDTGDKSRRYFGPYGGRGAAKAAINTVRDLFTLPDCRNKYPPRGLRVSRPCLRHDMGLCCAPCTGKVSEQEYGALIEQACLALEGKVGKLTEELKKQMEQKSEELDFEAAAEIRDKIKALNRMKLSQNVTGVSAGDCDVVAFASKSGKGCITVLLCDKGNLSGKKTFFFDNLEEQDGADAMSSFIKQYYTSVRQAPGTVCVSILPDDHELIEDMLYSILKKRVRLTIPQRGDKKKLLDIAIGNCYSELEVKNEWEAKAMAATRGFEQLTGLSDVQTIEAYDISNTAGQDAVASMTVFEKGRAVKARWRKFRIKYAVGGDDYGAMEEVIDRRLKKAAEGVRAFLPLPDVILVDGGQGQVKAAKKAAADNNIDVPILGMVKNEHHRTRALVDEQGREIGIKAVPSVFAFIGNIQERTHEYAVDYHHRVHNERSLKSELLSIRGMGEKRLDALLQAFGSMEKLKSATYDELIKYVPGETARSIISYFASGGFSE